MSMSIASLEDLSIRLTAIGRNHVVINGNGSIGKTTHWWLGRLVNRVLSKIFVCEKTDNIAVCNKFVALIKDTPQLGESYATLGKKMLATAGRLSGSSPLSGRKAAKVLARILILAKDDIHVTDTNPNAMLYREKIQFDIKKLAKPFGQESIPYARALVRRLADTRGALSKNEINDQLFLMMRHKHKELHSPTGAAGVPMAAMQDLLSSVDDKTKILKLQNALISLRSSHAWQANTHPAATWINHYTMKTLEFYTLVYQGELGSRPNSYKDIDVIRQMADSYGEDALPYAKKFMSLPLVTGEMLRDEMRNTYEQLQKDATAIVNREIGEQGRGRGVTLASFIDQITAERGPNPQPINQWMWHVLKNAAYERANSLLGLPNNKAQPAVVQMLNLA